MGEKEESEAVIEGEQWGHRVQPAPFQGSCTENQQLLSKGIGGHELFWWMTRRMDSDFE